MIFLLFVNWSVVQKDIIYRNTWLENIIMIFIIQQIRWKQDHVDLTVHSTLMLIKFTKLIAGSFPKINNQ